MIRPGAVYAKVRDPHPVAVDALITVLCAAIGVATELAVYEEGGGYRRGNAASVALALAATVPVMWRRAHPAAVMAVVAAAAAAHSLWLFPGAGPFLGGMTSLYSVAAYGSTRAARVSLAGLLAVQPLAILHDPMFNSWGDLVVSVIVVGAMWVFGDSRRMRRLHLAVVEERAARLERDRDARARLAVREERTRIAREMHDIVAHNVSVMVVQAGAARRMVERDPGAAAEAAGRVESTGRAALDEMRRVLGVLCDDHDPPVGGGEGAAALEPQPGLGAVPGLVAECRNAGLDVRVRAEGEVRPLPSGVELAAYRIVQEALTNTMRHAGPASAEVTLAYGDDALTVVVADDGRGGVAVPGAGGHGLPGMRERVAVYGGQLDAGARPEGGFRIRARLPLDRGAGGGVGL